jgi:hypothetical protein
MTGLIYWTLLAAWLTHIVASASAGHIFTMLLGALIFPGGIIHGVCLWLSVFS